MSLMKIDVCLSVDAPEDAIGKMIAMIQPNKESDQAVAQLDAALLDGWTVIGSAPSMRMENLVQRMYITFVLFKDTRRKLHDYDVTAGGPMIPYFERDD